MIEVQKVSKSFGNKVALDEISFNVSEGEIFGFLGPSGSGKTTLIKIITGQLLADSGSTSLLGINSKKLTAKSLENIGLVSDTSGFFELMTLEKNLLIYAKLFGIKPNKVDEILEKVGLLDSKKLVAKKLSTGMKQRMHLARALLHQPKVLFLDEPTSGLDPTTSKKIHSLLLELKSQGTTIFLTTHDMQEATLLCDRLALLNRGQLVEVGTPTEIIRRYNTDKKVKLGYDDELSQVVTFEQLKLTNLDQVETIHSCEPTLEDIFIARTGEKLNV